MAEAGSAAVAGRVGRRQLPPGLPPGRHSGQVRPSSLKLPCRNPGHWPAFMGAECCRMGSRERPGARAPGKAAPRPEAQFSLAPARRDLRSANGPQAAKCVDFFLVPSWMTHTGPQWFPWRACAIISI